MREIYESVGKKKKKNSYIRVGYCKEKNKEHRFPKHNTLPHILNEIVYCSLYKK